MKKIIFTLFTLLILVSCRKDDGLKITADNDTLTTLLINVEDEDGKSLSDIKVYAYNESTWEANGDNPDSANFSATSGDEGVANFRSLSTGTGFTESNDEKQTYRFSAHYTLNELNKTKAVSIFFNLGDDKQVTLTLD